VQFHKTHEQTWLKKPELARRLFFICSHDVEKALQYIQENAFISKLTKK